MRLLLLCLFSGVLGATPVVEKFADPPAIDTLSAGLPFGASNQTPETTEGSVAIESAADVSLAQDAKLLETAFLAGYPADVTLERFQAVTRSGGMDQPASIFDRLPLNSAGDLLTAGSGIFCLLMLAVVLVERLRLATVRP